MIFRGLLLVLCAGFLFSSKAQDSIGLRVILIGDGGSFIHDRHPVIAAVRQQEMLDKKSVVIYLGDNVYLAGLPDKTDSDYPLKKAVLDSQLLLVQGTDARLFMIPGNHDWDHSGRGGWEAVIRQQQYVDSLGLQQVHFFPEGGCPGPKEVLLNEQVLLVMMDSQWWLHTYDKPGVESDCDIKTEEEFLTRLTDILKRNTHRLVILASHHPFRSKGPHGGFYTWKHHLFPLTELHPALVIPLPVLGSVYPMARGVYGTPQDIPHPNYQRMIRRIREVADLHPQLVFVAGHEHTLQLLQDSAHYYVVSGSASKTSRVSKDPVETKFAANENGYGVIDVTTDNSAHIRFYGVQENEARLLHQQLLLSWKPVKPVLMPAEMPRRLFSWPDSMVMPVSKRYEIDRSLQRWVMGDNYRDVWSTPVKQKVFDVQRDHGGFEILNMGGGRQTKSLRLRDRQGREWTLRTLDKDPVSVLPENFRHTFAEDIAQDVISAAHPYAPLVVSELAARVRVIATKPEIVLVPDDPAFGMYRPIFANQVCLLEEREPTPDRSDTKSTPKLIEKMLESPEVGIDQALALRARLLDLLIGDWDRHFDQWRWGRRDSADFTTYYPIPRDRDQAFFYSDGIMLKLVSWKAIRYMRGFRDDIPRIDWLGWSSRQFDRLFLNQLSDADWKREIEAVTSALPDSVIHDAVNRMPEEIRPGTGRTIERKLKNRRDQLMQEGLKYYRFVNGTVNIFGTQERERILVQQAPDRGLRVRVFSWASPEADSILRYDRVFRVRETDQLRIYGLNGDDEFSIGADVSSPIRVRMIGGRGDDLFDVQGKLPNRVYDWKYENNRVLHPSRSSLRIQPGPDVHDLDILNFQYDQFKFPRFAMGFNAEDGLLLGVGMISQTQGFRKEPFATRQQAGLLYSPLRGAYQLAYTGEFNELFDGPVDLLLKGRLVNPVLNNFFGLGNETSDGGDDFDADFYRVRYKFVSGDALLRRRVSRVFSYYAGPSYFHYWNRYRDNDDKILGNPSLIGLDSASVYSSKNYLGARAGLMVDNINQRLFPTRGIQFQLEFSTLQGMGNTASSVTQLTTDLTLYSSLREPAKLVTVLRLGGGHIFNDNYEYFQALNIGQNNFLRGFRKNRFSGSSLLYGSLEARLRLFRLSSYILPGDVGLVAFGDGGRVWYRPEESRRWHGAIGGGMYFVPFNLALVSATVAGSDEGMLFNFSLGYKLNFTF